MIELKKLGYSGIRLMLDSGSFSALTQEKEINIADYMEFIHENLDYLDWYVNLDVIGRGQESYENYRIMRAEGLDPIPVSHLGTPKKYFRGYLDSTDYVGISLRKKVRVADSISELDQLWCDMLTDSQGYPRAKYHLFGVSSARIIGGYCWWSFDSASWALNSAYGKLLFPRQNRGLFSFSDTPSVIPVSLRQKDKDRYIGNLCPKERDRKDTSI